MGKIQDKIQDKIVCPQELLARVAQFRKQHKSIAFTNGCFDLLHAGHVGYLEEGSWLADILIVGINSDKSVRKLKGEGRPFNCEKDRAFVMAGLGFVHVVVLFDAPTPEKLISQISPDVLVKGGDYDVASISGAKGVREAGGRVMTLPFRRGHSTTNLVNKIRT